MIPQPITPPAHAGGGDCSLRATIIASLCSDEGACIMCADCGYVFVPSKPLSDESEPVDNTTLARKLWHHVCAIDRRPDREVRTRGRMSF